VGKTHLAAAIANYQAMGSYLAMFVVVPDLLDHVRAAFSQGVVFDDIDQLSDSGEPRLLYSEET
jgi:DNA replication protein DnaC